MPANPGHRGAMTKAARAFGSHAVPAKQGASGQAFAAGGVIGSAIVVLRGGRAGQRSIGRHWQRKREPPVTPTLSDAHG
jgi:hypothetical protein